MGREHQKKRRMSIRQNQKRKEKLSKLRVKYVKADNQSEKDQVWEKVHKLSPEITRDEFEKPIETAEKEAKEK